MADGTWKLAELDATWLANQVFVGGTLIVLTALTASVLLRRASSTSRYGVWVLAIVALAVSPLLSAPRATSPSGAPAAPAPTVAAARPTPTAAPSSSAIRSLAPAPPGRLPGPPPGWAWIWAAAVALALLRLRADVRAAHALERESEEAGPGLHRAFEPIRRAVCPRRAVTLRVHPEVGVPLLTGASNPVVLLPTAAARWQRSHLVSALRHELAHVVRHDYAVHLFARLVLALYAVNPITWLALRQLEREREHACDDLVVDWGTSATEYALHLVEIARSAASRRLGVAAAFAGRTGVRERVEWILSSRRGRRWGPVSWGSAIVVCAVTTLAVSGFQLLTTSHEARRSDALRRLSSSEAAVRRHGAWMLGELESAPDARALAEAFDDPVAEVRMAVAWALGEIKDPSSVPALVAALDDPDARVREIAALSIGEVGDPRGVRPLAEAAARDPNLRQPAAWALTEIGGSELAVEQAVLDDRTAAPAPEVWAGPFQGTVALAVASPAQLLDALAASDPERRRAAALALGRVGTEDAVDALLDLLSDPSPGARAAAVWALDEINPSH